MTFLTKFALPVALVIVFAAVVFIVSTTLSKSFDHKVWQSTPSRRAAMIDDLLQGHKLIGLSHDQVGAMLGVPDRIGLQGTYNSLQEKLYYRCLDGKGDVSWFIVDCSGEQLDMKKGGCTVGDTKVTGARLVSGSEVAKLRLPAPMRDEK